MNDTIAIIGTPVVLLLAKQCKLPPKLMLLTLAFAVTIGSVMSPIGNPQNVLVAINGNVANPFGTFLPFPSITDGVEPFRSFHSVKILLQERPTNLRNRTIRGTGERSQIGAAFQDFTRLNSHLSYSKNNHRPLKHSNRLQTNLHRADTCLPIIALSPRRVEVIKKIDWSTLVFFAAMFVLMESVWESGFFQSAIVGLNLNITSIVAILMVSTLLSQLISNVPLVALYLPMLINAGASAKELMALAAGSTVAGNLFILGAASNVIIIQNAEKKFGETITFLDFAKIGIILTAINLLVYWLFLIVVPKQLDGTSN
jgi:Na+/H+ antiporter NhaD/arsenite permease-like protein